MKPLILFYPHDSVFSGVKQESSQLAVRTKDKEGNDLFEELVFDEAYLDKFRELFLDAQAEVMPVISAYLKDAPPRPDFFELIDHTDDKDFEIVLLMPEEFVSALSKSVDIKINQFITAYVMYRWLETKLPQEAVSYKSRADVLLVDVKSLLNRRIKPINRWHGLF